MARVKNVQDERDFRDKLAALVMRIYPDIEEIPIAWDGVSLNPNDKLFNWRDPVRPEPTRAELEAAYDEWLADDAIEQDKKTQVANDKSSVNIQNVTAALNKIDARRTQISNDIAALPTANAAQQRAIVTRMLNAEDETLAALGQLLKAIRHLV